MLMQRRNRSSTTPRPASARAASRPDVAANQPNDSHHRPSNSLEASHSSDITTGHSEVNKEKPVPGYLRGTKASESRKVETRGHPEARETAETRETAKRSPFSLVSNNRLTTPKSTNSTGADTTKGAWKRQAAIRGQTSLIKPLGTRSNAKPQAAKQVRFPEDMESNGSQSCTADSVKASLPQTKNELHAHSQAVTSPETAASELSTRTRLGISQQVEASLNSSEPHLSSFGFAIGSKPARKSKIPSASAFRSKVTSFPSRALSAVTSHFVQSQSSVQSPENRLGMSPMGLQTMETNPYSSVVRASDGLANQTDSSTQPEVSTGPADEMMSKRAFFPSKTLSVETRPFIQNQSMDPSPEKPLGISPPWSQLKSDCINEKAEVSLTTPLNFSFGLGESNIPSPTVGLSAMLGMFSTFSEAWKEPANDDCEDLSSVENSMDVPSIIVPRQSLGGVSEISANSTTYSLDVTSESEEETTSTISSMLSSRVSSAQRSNSSNGRLLQDSNNDTFCDDEEATSQQKLLHLPEYLRVQQSVVQEDIHKEDKILQIRSSNNMSSSIALNHSGGKERAPSPIPDLVPETDSSQCLLSPTSIEEEFPHGVATLCVGCLLKSGGDDSISETSESQTSSLFNSELVEESTELLHLPDSMPLPTFSDDIFSANPQDESLMMGDDSQLMLDTIHKLTSDDETPAIDEAIELFSNEIPLVDYHENLLDDLNPTLDHSLWLLTLSMNGEDNEELDVDLTLPGYLSDEAMQPPIFRTKSLPSSESITNSLTPALKEQGIAASSGASSSTCKVTEMADQVGTYKIIGADIPRDPTDDFQRSDSPTPSDDEILQLRIQVKQLSKEKTELGHLLASLDEERIRLLVENERLERENVSLKAVAEGLAHQLELHYEQRVK
jgi:hypothetical protein